MGKTKLELEKQLIDNIMKDFPDVKPSKLDALIKQIEGYEMTINYELIAFPFFFFKARWERIAQIRTARSILKIAKRFKEEIK